MSERFYVNCPLAPGSVTLKGAEAHHLAAVCRLRPGQQVCLFNGDGREYLAAIQVVERRHAELEVVAASTPNRELPFQLTVACPLPKGDRGQFLIEKLTELGATAYVPLRTQRSVVHPREDRSKKLERHVIEACKQCGRNVLMRIGVLESWADFAAGPQLPPARLLADSGGEPFPRGLPPGDVAIAIGPEGGFSAEEGSLAWDAGWRLVNLGPRILRLETAALALCSLAANLGSRGGEGNAR